jgi:hypothetical protein
MWQTPNLKRKPKPGPAPRLPLDCGVAPAPEPRATDYEQRETEDTRHENQYRPAARARMQVCKLRKRQVRIRPHF